MVKLALPRQEKYQTLAGFPSQPAQNRPGPVCPAYLVHTAPTLYFFNCYSSIIPFFQNGVTTVLDVDCHSMLYLFYVVRANGEDHLLGAPGVVSSTGLLQLKLSKKCWKSSNLFKYIFLLSTYVVLELYHNLKN